jgi:Concanavalin A-like lectin/glucanases superfamily/Fibronectin type III domain
MPILYYKTMKNLYIIISLLLLTSSLDSLNIDLSIGGSSGWGKIEQLTNIDLIEGKGKGSILQLKSAVYSQNDFTDLLIHFDDTRIIDVTGNYQIEANIENTHIEKFMGNGSGVFRGEEESLNLYPGKKAIFSGNNPVDSFSIEFWLKPSRFSENPILLSYQGILRDNKRNLIPQELLCSMDNRKLSWKLNNIFYSEERNIDIQLNGLSTIIPDEWHHHLLRFDADTGIIEYLLDGVLEAIQYASKTGTEDGSIFYPLLSSSWNTHLVLGKNYVGYMDELRISREYIQDPVLYRYQGISGNIVSKIIDLERSYSIIKKINIEYENPMDSAIFFYYNISNNLEIMYDETNWVEFSPGEILISKNMGKYLKVKMNLLSDGEEILTPIVSNIQITYEKNLQPLAPSYLHGIGKENSVALTWPNMIEADIKGYILYYGTKKGVYFGNEAIEGPSPLIVLGKESTSLTVNGLTNGKLYHFAIAAFDDAGIEYPGILSTEITCRPVSTGTN